MISEYKGDHPGKNSTPTVVVHTYKKNCNKGGCTCQKVKFNKIQVKCETIVALISSTYVMTNNILDDGHFAQKRQKLRGKKKKKGFMYLIMWQK